MSLGTALDDLRTTNTSLRQAVSELVITVLDDHPLDGPRAIHESLAEVVTEFQASVAEAGDELQAISDVREIPVRLPAVDAAIAASCTRYWKDLRAYGPVAKLRVAAREQGIEWRTWQSSLEQSQLRCEEPLMRSAASVRAAWQEVGELLSLYLPATTAPLPTQSAEPNTAAAPARPMSTRRPS